MAGPRTLIHLTGGQTKVVAGALDDVLAKVGVADSALVRLEDEYGGALVVNLAHVTHVTAHWDDEDESGEGKLPFDSLD